MKKMNKYNLENEPLPVPQVCFSLASLCNKKIITLFIFLLFFILFIIFFLKFFKHDSPKQQITTIKYQYSAPWNKELFDNYFKTAKTVPFVGNVKGGIVPHHLLAGDIPASFFAYLSKQKPSVVVILSPNHFSTGNYSIISTLRDWQTPYGIVLSQTDIIKELEQNIILRIDETAIKEEHGLYSLIPFIKKSLPQATVVAIMIKDKTDVKYLDNLIAQINKVLPSDSVIIASIDFSHYMTVKQAIANDAISQEAIKNFNYDKVLKLNLDSPSSLYVLLKLMEKSNAKKIGYEISGNSAQYLHNPLPNDTVSYYSPYFVKSN